MLKAWADRAESIASGESPAPTASGFDPELLRLVYDVGKSYIDEGLKTFSEWSAAMRQHFGEDVDLQGTWDELNKPVDPGVQFPKATGIANVVNEHEAYLYGDIPKGTGKSPAEWQAIGQQKVAEGADYWALARDASAGTAEATGENAAVLVAGKADLMRKLRDAMGNLSANPADKRLQDAVESAREDLALFGRLVQPLKSKGSDFFRALQAGTDIDLGNFEDVVNAMSKGGAVKVSQRLADQAQKFSDEIKALNDRIALLEANPAVHDADQSVKLINKGGPRRFDRAQIDARIQKNVSRLKALRGAGGVGQSRTRGAASLITSEDIRTAKEQAQIVLDIAKDVIVSKNLSRIEDVVLAVRELLGGHGFEIEDDAVYEALAPRKGAPASPEQKAVAGVRREAGKLTESGKAEAAAREAKREADAYDRAVQTQRDAIADMKESLRTGKVKPKGKAKPVAEEVADLKAQRRILEGKVRAMIRENESSWDADRAKWLLRQLGGTASTIRGLLLGGDLGVILRQGAFTNPVLRPKVWLKSVGEAGKAMFSEKNLAKWAEALETKRYRDGRSALRVRKDAGLSLTDAINEHEEMVWTRLMRKIPWIGDWIGGAFERAQTVFINTARTGAFDSLVEAGASPEALRIRAQFINNASGRGNFARVPHDALYVVMTSPRYEKSRWAMITTEPIKNLLLLPSGKMRKGAAQNLVDLGGFIGTVYLVGKAAEMAGYEMHWDPDDPDFGYMRKGDEVWDVSAGIVPRLKTLFRVIKGTREPTPFNNLGAELGKSVVRAMSPGIREPYVAGSRFAQEKQNEGLLKPEDPRDPVSGYEFDESDPEGWEAFLPLVVQGIQQSAKNGGTGLDMLWTGLREFFGTSVRYYPRKEKK